MAALAVLGEGDVGQPAFSAAPSFPSYRASAVSFFDGGARRLRTATPVTNTQPTFGFAIYRNNDPTTGTTRYLCDGSITSARHIFRMGGTTAA